ncbi:uncharacterized protein EV422DRAFT_50699 [Fimicolochytrium jonesii]|uniref:uncharacterized protein n=1 Tax=Fimicolochytrium jonesii TaxID=1396493 RepID=UPI0022FEA5AA|nr:uncharacterized protein EV422DRAFT_50699 [Fimicolochytrium jonesii]KAI8821048.1 hypothetical protein EV422DRAFT_50699 [Fimicolochytrium jonesii]
MLERQTTLSLVDIASTIELQPDGRLSLTSFHNTPAAWATEERAIRGGGGQVPSDSYSELFQPAPDESPLQQQQQSRTGSRIEVERVPFMNVVIQIVGSRGDVQPFLALAKALQDYGHRVRIATHETFRTWIRRNAVEFYPIGGDPAELMAFMVENKGVIPTYASVAKGDVGKKRKMIREILQGAWRSCVLPDDETGVPFQASVIIANPPSFGHIHCAEKLGIPLHMSFTMPWLPTISFPHPLTNIDHSKTVSKLLNKMSYGIVETLTWLGVGDVVNEFRVFSLDLRPMSVQQGTQTVQELKVPWSFCWSPSLIPKPVDWGPHIGFYFLDQATTYTPPADLQNFLASGPPPIYIGFGSITGHDPVKFTNTILKAVKLANVRAIISKGWMGMGDGGAGIAKTVGTEDPPPDPNVFFIGDCPHDWLFKHVAAVCHHGGAGTLSAGLRYGRPTIVVPFFGDQFFWGAMVYRMKAGPLPLPAVTLTPAALANAITAALTPETRRIAQRISEEMSQEDGIQAGVTSFHRSLPLPHLHSDLNATHAAAYKIPKMKLKVSRPVAQVLVCAGLITERDLRVLRTQKWFVPHDHDGIPGTAAVRVLGNAVRVVVSYPVLRVRQVRDRGGGRVREAVAAVLGVLLALLRWVFVPFEVVYHTFNEIADAVTSLPRLYDHTFTPRPTPPINDLPAGLREGCKHVYLGLADGVADFFHKPAIYAGRHGCILGAPLGVCVGVLNLAVIPTGGLLQGIGCWAKGAVRQVLRPTFVKSVPEGALGVEPPPRITHTDGRSWTFRSRGGGPGGLAGLGTAWVENAAAAAGLEPGECRNIVGRYRMMVERKKQATWWRRLVPRRREGWVRQTQVAPV